MSQTNDQPTTPDAPEELLPLTTRGANIIDAKGHAIADAFTEANALFLVKEINARRTPAAASEPAPSWPLPLTASGSHILDSTGKRIAEAPSVHGAQEIVAALNRAPAAVAGRKREWHNPANLDSPGLPPWRFLLDREEKQTGDEFWSPALDQWILVSMVSEGTADDTTYRTKRLPPPTEPAATKCPACNGSGVHMLSAYPCETDPPCEVCQGLGKIQQPAADVRKAAATPITDEAWVQAVAQFLPDHQPAAKGHHWYEVARAMRAIGQRLEIERAARHIPAPAPDALAALRAAREAFEEIEKGEGLYHRDPLKHAENVIDKSEALAKVALIVVNAAIAQLEAGGGK